MDGGGVSAAAGGVEQAVTAATAAPGRRGRPAGGIAIVEHAGDWWVVGRLYYAGSVGRVRQSTRLPATPENLAAAEERRRQAESALRARLAGEPGAALPAPVGAAARLRTMAAGRKRRRAAGIAVVERDGHWHVEGRCRIKGQSKRVRQSTGLSATADNKDAAEELRR